MKIAWSPLYRHQLPPGHRFPMEKYDLIPEQLLYEGTITQDNIFTPQPVDFLTASLVHDPVYLQKLLDLNLNEKEIRRSGFPLSAALIEREFLIAGGTLQCCYHALNDGVSFNIAGGTHHAYADKAEGFCLLNDNAIAAASLLQKKLASSVLMVDLDVHQGNGTAHIFKNTPEVFTFSMHAGHNFPMQKELSDLDIPLPDGCSDDQYLSTLTMILPELFDQQKPDFVFFISGVDVLETDKLGRLKLTKAGCKERDQLVLKECHDRNVPVVITMGGGYSPKISDIVEAHCNTYRIAQSLYS